MTKRRVCKDLGILRLILLAAVPSLITLSISDRARGDRFFLAPAHGVAILMTLSGRP